MLRAPNQFNKALNTHLIDKVILIVYCSNKDLLEPTLRLGAIGKTRNMWCEQLEDGGVYNWRMTECQINDRWQWRMSKNRDLEASVKLQNRSCLCTEKVVRVNKWKPHPEAVRVKSTASYNRMYWLYLCHVEQGVLPPLVPGRQDPGEFRGGITPHHTGHFNVLPNVTGTILWWLDQKWGHWNNNYCIIIQ